MYPPGSPYQNYPQQQGYPPPQGYAPPGAPYPVPNEDENHLKVLSVLHYVYGAMLGVAGLVGLLYVVLGAAVATAGAAGGSGAGAAEVVGGFFAIIGLIILVLVWAKAALVIYAGYCLAKRKHHTLCIVVACLTCLGIPLGTLLGVFTMVVLLRPTVKPLFGVPA